MDPILIQLRSELNRISPVPEGCASFSDLPKMEGTAFFPGGDGLFKTRDGARSSFPVGGVLVLGSDFGDEVSYARQFAQENTWHDEGDGPTWRNLLQLTDRARIQRSELFCTNAWPCLRKGNRAVGGVPPGAKDPEFTRRCQDFFLLTLDLMRPHIIIPLGLRPTAFIAPIGVPQSPWGRASAWSHIDATPIWQRSDAWVVPIVHPSMPNRRHRAHAKTLDAEAELLSQARRSAGRE